MKRSITYVVFFFFALINLVGCSSSANNSITFNNSTESDIYINFRGSLIDIPAGQNSVIKEIPKGTYDYATTFAVPAGTTSSSSQGNLSGTLKIQAGTKILFLYSSTFSNGTYTVFVTMSNSDNQSATSPTAP
ncbi:MAG: hypothetical protein M1480_19430 [Bacteroidetes bacterium]|nr:hypothetical protein [Bacteroidota bacterium]